LNAAALTHLRALPPQVNLKRKHWDRSGSQATASERCKAIFMKQMDDARRKMGGLAESAGLGVAPGGGSGKRAKLQGGEQEAVRQQVIDAYREMRGHVVGQASKGSLKSLAKGKAV
jgi:hypothetical protein